MIAEELRAMFDIPCQTLPNFLNLTLTPSNQVPPTNHTPTSEGSC